MCVSIWIQRRIRNQPAPVAVLLICYFPFFSFHSILPRENVLRGGACCRCSSKQYPRSRGASETIKSRRVIESEEYFREYSVRRYLLREGIRHVLHRPGIARDRFISRERFIGVPPRNYHIASCLRFIARAIIHKDKRTYILFGARAAVIEPRGIQTRGARRDTSGENEPS